MNQLSTQCCTSTTSCILCRKSVRKEKRLWFLNCSKGSVRKYTILDYHFINYLSQYYVHSINNIDIRTYSQRQPIIMSRKSNTKISILYKKYSVYSVYRKWIVIFHYMLVAKILISTYNYALSFSTNKQSKNSLFNMAYSIQLIIIYCSAKMWYAWESRPSWVIKSNTINSCLI